MVWKLLSALSAVCLGTACFFAWANQKALVEERKREASHVADLQTVKSHKAEAEEAKKAKETQVAELTKELDAAKLATVEIAAKAVAKEQELSLSKTNLDQVTKTVTDLQKQIDDAGDIPGLLAQIDLIKKERAEAEAALANQTQRFAAAQARVDSLNSSAKEAEERETRGRRGIVDTDFTAKVAKSYSDWGFVVINKGNGGGVFANADLEVKRGKDVIAKLKVRNVEQNSSVAELVPGSLAEGGSIRSGDTVVASAEQQSAKPKPAPGAPAAPGTATAPVGTTPAMGAPAAATASDPFGAPATPPAGAPAMNSDPFGAPATPAGAPAAPAPAMGGDPFGAPPATPPAAGTPAAPSTADPFAPKP